MNRKTALLPVISLVLSMILWASAFIATKLAFQVYDPMVVIFGRMAVGSLASLVFFRAMKGNVWRKGDLKYLAFMILCEPCLYFLFEAKALENTSASQAGMITAILPLMVAVAASVFLRERVTRKTLAGFIVAISGVLLLSTGGAPSEQAPHPAWGNFLEVLAMTCAAAYTVILKKLTERYRPFFLTALQAYAGSVFYLPVLLMPGTALPTEIVPVPFFSILYLGVFVTLGAYGLYNFGVSRVPASQASAFMNLIPVFTVFLGWLILGEKFTLIQYLASSLVFAGVFLSQGQLSETAVPPGPGRERPVDTPLQAP
ncbi:MAG TPA: DMT family transporter [Deltaproteobacteria bacterium]|nr:DMT family transporter [Deltaproteobacteria bacterium]